MNKKRLLLLGNVNSRWVFRYIKKVMLEDFDMTIINMAKAQDALGAEHYEYCEEQGIKVISIFNDVGYSRCIKYANYIRSLPDFDICHIMFVSGEASLIAYLCHDKIGEIVANFWGSDCYRRAPDLDYEQNLLMEVVDTVLVCAKKMGDELLKRYPQLEGRVHTVYFESAKIEIMQRGLLEQDVVMYDDVFKDKIVVAAGYNGRESQQHKMLFEAIDRCRKEVRDRIVVLVMVSYGLTPEYEQFIDNELRKAQFESVVMKDFITDEQMVRLRQRIDISINGSVSDSLNAALQESVYCGSVIINGSWLKYSELEDVYIVEFDNKDDLTKQLENIVDNIDIYKGKSKQNKCIMEKMFEKRGNVENWLEFYKGEWYRKQVSTSHVYQYIFEKHQVQLSRRFMYEKVYSNWLKHRIEGVHPVAEHIGNNAIAYVVIYGAGTLGELVYKEIQDLDIHIAICDKKIDKVDWYNGNISSPVDLVYDQVELFIITPVHVYDEIVLEIGLWGDERAISLLDLVG